MRSLFLILWSVLCLVLPAPVVHAGSYPADGSTQAFDYPSRTVDFGDGSVIGSDKTTGGGSPVAGVVSSALRLADKSTKDAIGSLKLPDLDPGNAVGGFDLAFDLIMNKATAGSVGEGWSLNFGDLPEDFGTGEGGFAPLPGGLTIAFDTGDDTEDPTSVEVSAGGVVVAEFPWTFGYRTAGRRTLIHWDSATGLDITYDRKVVCAGLPLPGFGPGVGNRFGFTARTTSSTMDVILDNLKVGTVALPAIESGGPIISEFVADNSDLEDEFADKPGWIELLNGSAEPVDLSGWYLTDNKEKLTKWKIEGLTLGAYGYRVVFASKRNRQLSATSLMHTNFRLANDGGYVALVRPDGTTVASSYEYGPQDEHVGYGEQGVLRTRGYMYPTTPGAVNVHEAHEHSASAEPTFSHTGGLIAEPLSLTISAPEIAGTEVRYTLDNTEPGPDSTLYEQPLEITQSTTVKARVYTPGYIPGQPLSCTFVLIDDTLKNFAETGKVFESNLPVVYLDSFGFNVDGSTGGTQAFRPAFAAVLAPDPATGRVSLTAPPEYAGPAGVHVRGESSSGFDQKSYALEIWDEAGNDKDAGLLGMPAESDWILYAPWSEKTFMRNKMVYDWMRAMRGEDGTAVRTRFVEVFFNQRRNTTQIGYSTTYRGVYVLMEKIKRGKNRVPLANLNERTVDPELITGGYIIRRDKDDPIKTKWTSKGGQPLQSFDPDQINATQLAYIQGYVNNFEAALNGGDSRDLVKGYQAWIDPASFIDAQWMLEVAKQVDGYVFSTYFHKDRGGRLRGGPLWDFNISLGNADYATGDRATGWLYDNANGAGQNWYPRLHADPEYKLAHWDRYWQLRRTLLSDEAVIATIDGHMATLLDGFTEPVGNRAPAEVQNPVARHFRKWPRLGIRDWPNPPAETGLKTWQAEVDYMKNWILTRLTWLDDQSMLRSRVVYRPPVFSHSGGAIAGPIELSMASYEATEPATKYPVGEVYFTLDGSDPRLPEDGVSQNATKYAAPISIDRAMTVNARMVNGDKWTALATATFSLNTVPASSGNLAITELMFAPASPSPTELEANIVDASLFEFVEITNISNQTVDLSGAKFGDGIGFDFGLGSASVRFLSPGASALIVADNRAFRLRYGESPSALVAGEFHGRLNNGGEKISLFGSGGGVIREFSYQDGEPWPVDAEGTGRSIMLLDPASNPDPDKPTSWVLSASPGGTPGETGIGGGGDMFTGDPGKDTDGDGFGDLLEFATGSDANDPRSGSSPTVEIRALEVIGTIGDYVVFEFRRRSSARGIVFAVESSGDLGAWSAADFVPVGSTDNGDGTVAEQYRSPLPLRGNNDAIPDQYLRLAVHLQ